MLLPADSAAEAALRAGDSPAAVAAAYPAASVAWAELAEEALAADKAVTAYAYARTGYQAGGAEKYVTLLDDCDPGARAGLGLV